jgi:hypothetical protein
MGGASLQAINASIIPSEAHCKLKLIEEVSVLVAPETYAFVYDLTAKEPTSNQRDAFLVTTPLAFNSKGPIKNMTYAAGQATVPTGGSYQVIYSIDPVIGKGRPNSIALAVNGKEIKASRIAVKKTAPNYRKSNGRSRTPLIMANFILQLNQGDQVSLILPDASPSYLSLKSGINASLLITKL